MSQRKVLRYLGVSLLLALSCATARAQSAFPEKLITIVLGYNAGTGADLIARNLATLLSSAIGKPVIVENKPGALTKIGAEYVANAKPDGHTLFFTAGNSTFAINAYLFKKLPFDPIKSFVPITSIGRVPFVLMVSANSPARNVADLSRLLREKGDKGSYGSSTPFSVAISELYKSIAVLKTTQIPYKGSDQAMPDLANGALDFMLADAGSSAPHLRGNRVRALAVTTAQASPLMPDLPTMIESGVPGFDVSAWLAVYAPAGTPRPIVDQLARLINQTMAGEKMKQVLTTFVYDPMPGTPDGLAKYNADEIEKWGAMMKAANIPQE